MTICPKIEAKRRSRLKPKEGATGENEGKAL
jgi:hypothetical protein